MSTSHTTGNGQNPSPAKEREIISQEWLSPLLLLLEVDPAHIYACWEVWPEDLTAIGEQLKGIFQQTRLTLRIFAGDGNEQQPGSYFDVPVEGWKNDWYIEVPQSDRAYFAELGLISLSSNDFYVIKRSNVVKTPKNILSPPQQHQEQWMKVLGEYETISMVNPDEQLLARQLLPQQPPSSQTRKSISRKMIEEYYSNLPQDQPREVMELQGENIPCWPASPASSPENALLPLWDAEEPAGMAGQVASSSPFSLSSLSSASFGASGILSSYFSASLSSPASSPLSSPFSSYLSSYPSASMGNYSSLNNRRSEETSSESSSPRQVKGFFQYDLDLLIYGRAQPGAAVYIGEDAVEVQPDGSFSCRLNLSQQGRHWITLRACLPEGGEVHEFIPVWLQKIRVSGD
ncbi:MAG: DUF4912 domain-containing protein [bacterium]